MEYKKILLNDEELTLLKRLVASESVRCNSKISDNEEKYNYAEMSYLHKKNNICQNLLYLMQYLEREENNEE